MRNRLRLRHGLYLWALLAAPVVYGLSFPPWRLSWAAWVGLVPWYVALRSVPRRGAVLIACVSTLLGSYVCTTWLPRAVATYYQQPLALGLLLFVLVYAGTIAPYICAFTVYLHWLAQRPSRWLPFWTAAAWTAAEVGRVRLFIGEPFGLFGYSQVEVAPLMQVADLTGIYGVSFLLMAANSALAELWLAYHRPRALPSVTVPTRVQAWQGVMLVMAMLAGCLTYGMVRTRAVDREPLTAGTRIAIVQGNLDVGAQWRQSLYGVNLDTYLRLTQEALRAGAPQVVFWPESALTFFLSDEPAYRAAIGRVLTPAQVELVTGGPRAVGRPSPRYYNSGFLVAADGQIVTAYDKQHLLPFAEYFPFGGLGLLRRQFARVREFTPGGAARLLPTVAGLAGVVICNEAMFGDIAGDRVRAGANYLVTLSNDSWLGDRNYAEQAFDMARVRAIEQRRYLVRASTSGPSGIIDPSGGVIVRTADDTRATVGGRVYGSATLSVYGRFGDLFGAMCALLSLALLAVRIVRRRSQAPERGH